MKGRWKALYEKLSSLMPEARQPQANGQDARGERRLLGVDASLREVTIRIGKIILSENHFDDESIKAITDLSADITREFEGSLDQENLLLLSCLQLAWLLEKLGRKLERSLDDIREKEGL